MSLFGTCPYLVVQWSYFVICYIIVLKVYKHMIWLSSVVFFLKILFCIFVIKGACILFISTEFTHNSLLLSVCGLWILCEWKDKPISNLVLKLQSGGKCELLCVLLVVFVVFFDQYLLKCEGSRSSEKPYFLSLQIHVLVWIETTPALYNSL